MNVLSHLLLALTLIGCSTEEVDTHQPKVIPIPTHQWIRIDSIIGSPQDVQLAGFGIIKLDVEGLSILALDTHELFLMYESERSEPDTVGFKPYFHELYDPAWERAEDGITPALTRKEVPVYSRFIDSQLLNKPIPDFVLYDHAGKEYDKSYFKGKVSVIDFWWKGCSACVVEAPTMNSIAKKYESRNDVQFVSLYRDSLLLDPVSGEKLFEVNFPKEPKFIPIDESNRVTFKHLGPARNIMKQFYLVAAPTHIIVDQEGIVRDVFSGASPSDDQFEIKWRIDYWVDQLAAKELAVYD